MKKLILGAGLGALTTWFLDPQTGARRRNVTRDRILAFFRRGRYAARGVAADAYGLKQKATHLREEEKLPRNDATLADKVRSEVLRDADMPKGSINVNAENGIVILRGEVERPELIDELERKVRRVQGVERVENLLHLPGSEPRMHQAHHQAHH
jgi:osmotically-inducible protein OsmY